MADWEGWALRVISEPSPFKPLEKLYLDAMKALRAMGMRSSDVPWLYVSTYRPMIGVRPNMLGVDASFVFSDPTRSVLATDVPLTVETVETFQLTPLDVAMGQFILDFAKKKREPIELAHPDGVRAALLFKNPRKIWQLSLFEDGIGPTGHLESEEPAVLALTAWRQGYRRWSPGIVDAIVGNLTEG